MEHSWRARAESTRTPRAGGIIACRRNRVGTVRPPDSKDVRMNQGGIVFTLRYEEVTYTACSRDLTGRPYRTEA